LVSKIIQLITCFSISFFTTLIIVPFINKISFKFNLIDYPDNRKQHKKKIVRIGGLGIFLGVFISVLYISINSLLTLENPLILDFLFIGSALFFLLGFLDDIFNLSPFLRLFIQFLISVLIWLSGIQISNLEFNIFNFGGFNIYLSDGFSLFFTVFWITGFINGLNWIDGLDGLAIGMTLISSTGLTLYALLTGNTEYIFLLVTIIGSGLGFLIHNWYPAKILMGDGGSYFLGSILSISSISLFSAYKNISMTQKESNSILIIQLLLIFSIPIFDMFFVILSRILNNKSIFNADRSHFHHRILQKGFSHKNTVIVMCAFSQFFMILGITSLIIEYRFLALFISLCILNLVILYNFDLEKLLRLNFKPSKK